MQVRPIPKYINKIIPLIKFDTLREVIEYFFCEDIELDNVLIKGDTLLFKDIDNEEEYFSQLDNYLKDLIKEKDRLEKEIKEVNSILKPF